MIAAELQNAPTNIAGMDREALAGALASDFDLDAKKARMRAAQIWRWIYHAGATDFGAMTNISKEMRAELSQRFAICRPEMVERQISTDGTRKYLLRMAPGIEAECVFCRLNIPAVYVKLGIGLAGFPYQGKESVCCAC